MIADEMIEAIVTKNTDPKSESAQTPFEEYCKVKLDSLFQLKDSTKKLLFLIEEIQTKTSPSRPIPNAFSLSADNTKIASLTECPSKISDIPTAETAFYNLEEQIKNVDEFVVENEHECTVYKRLTRKCHCLNRIEYNDFIIHFNENTRFSTSISGEIIKNMRILKKFLYMGTVYTKNSLMFLNEGLTKSAHSEKVDIILACSHADVCNVFENDSFIKICITWPINYQNFGDAMTQNLAARVLYRLAYIEEGRRYLNFNSKTTNDIKRVLRRRASELASDTVEFLKSALSLLSPSIIPQINSTYCKADEGVAMKVLNSLVHFRIFMTLEEVINSLNMLVKLSDIDKGKLELKQHIHNLYSIFKYMLMEYDNSEINVLIMTIIKNLLNKPTVATNEVTKVYVVTAAETEPPNMKHEVIQIPSRRYINRKFVKSKVGSFLKSHKPPRSSQNVFKSSIHVSAGDCRKNNSSKSANNRSKIRETTPSKTSKPSSKVFNKKGLRSSIIIVPMEKLKK